MLSIRAKRNYNLPAIQKYRPPSKLDAPRKLREILTNHYNNKTASVTFGILDPVQVVQAAPYIDTVYISGWTCASMYTSNNFFGADLADYPSTTLPMQLQRLRNAQELHSVRLQKDICHPIIADGDTGFGGATAVMKLTRMMIENGAAGMHLEDQRVDGKRCGHLSGKILVSCEAHIEKLRAARLQADIMESDLVLVSRTDAESATHIDTDIDPRDKPFILGKVSGQNIPSELKTTELTLPELIKKLCEYKSVPCPPLSYMNIDELSAQLKNLDPTVQFDTSVLRSKEGFYKIRSGTAFAINRAKHFSDYADLQWIETSQPDLSQAIQIAKELPIPLAYNLSPSFNWDKDHTELSMKSFSNDIAKLGFCWQFSTVAAFHLYGLATTRFAKAFKEDSMLAYVKDIQRKEREEGVDTYKHQNWSGVNLIDEMVSLVSSSERKAGEGSTEKHF